MDRKIIYPGQIPMVEDQLQAARFTQIGVGRLAGALYDESGTGASGFTCTPGSGLSITISPGQIIQPGVVDVSAFGVLPASASTLPRQYILADPVNIAIPGAGATYIVYGTPGTTDTANAVLPYYNSANPAQTFAGTGNGGQNQPTVRADSVTIGVATSAPSGSIPLWVITVPSSATSITLAMISAASGAPLYPSLRSLAMRSVAPFNANLAAAFKGYPSKALVADPTTTGLFWVSTTDNNLTTPGASGASWANLFAGLVANSGSSQGGIVKAGIDTTTGNPAFQDGNGTWHIVQPAGDYQPAGNYQPAGSYLVTNGSTAQSVSGPVAFTGSPTAVTASTGDRSTALATTAFATPGRLLRTNTITSSLTYIPPRVDATLLFRVRVCGAGGGGASVAPQNAYCASSGGGGGAGSYLEVWMTYAQLFGTASTLQIVIGKGGIPNNNGGQTTVGQYVFAPGGLGAPTANGGGYTTISPPGAASSEGSITNGYQNLVASIRGQAGYPGHCANPQQGGNFFYLSGSGGSAPCGTGGDTVGQGAVGIAGTRGGGGSGACSARVTDGSSAYLNGGNGGDGWVSIEAYEGTFY